MCSFCRPRALASYVTAAGDADDRLTGLASDLQAALDRFRTSGSEMMPSIGDHGAAVTTLRNENRHLSAFVLDVANAFVAADGGAIDLANAPADLLLSADTDLIEALTGEASVDRVRAEQDRDAILDALERGDDDALAAALEQAEEHLAESGDGYAATLVLLMGQDGVAAVLDRVDHDVGVPDEDDVENIAEPMARLFAAATQSGNPEVLDIAYGFLADADSATLVTDVYSGPYYFEDPELRRRLGLLLTASQADAQWVAEAADVLLVGNGAANDTETQTYNQMTLQALADHDEAAFLYVTSTDGTFNSTLDERLEELLGADYTLTDWPDGLSGGDQHDFDTETRPLFAQLAADVLTSGLADWPERYGNPMTVDIAAADAAATAETYALIVNMTGDNRENGPGGPILSGPDGSNDPIYEALAGILSSTWMMDRISRDAVGGVAQANGQPATPDGIDNLRTLEEYYEMLLESDRARDLLQAGTLAYLQHQVAMAVAAGIDPADVAAGNFGLDQGTYPALYGAGGAVTALTEAIEGRELDAQERAAVLADWIRALGGSGSGAGGATAFALPLAIFGPLTAEGVAQIVDGSAEPAGEGGQVLVESTDAILIAVEQAVASDPRFAGLTPEQRDAIENEVYEQALLKILSAIVISEQLTPGS